jgi:uncharacterized protein YgbK (DUF1537 family)
MKKVLKVLTIQERLAALPPEGPEDPLSALTERVRAEGKKVVVLDDDPTGTQTVHSVPVLTEWSVEALEAEFGNDLPAFYILTNSRSLSPADAEALNREMGANLREAAGRAQQEFVVISRSDSTLRGHFPGEVAALAEGLRLVFDAWILIPFFLEGGRLTLDDIHYLTEGDQLIPVGETEFARDAAFGYKASHLREWVVEKFLGRIPEEKVASIPLEELRQEGKERVQEHLLALPPGAVCIVNAVTMRDLAVFTQGLLLAEETGRHYLYRTAASFVPLRAGIALRPLLRAEELELPADGGGLIVVGSYVQKTTRQLECLRERLGVQAIEAPVEALLSEADYDACVVGVTQAVEMGLRDGRDVVLYTSRTLAAAHEGAHSLAVGRRISAGLTAIVQRLEVRPRYIIAKGGITSSDLATKALGVRRAMTLGQIVPGVPVWRLGPESRFPGLAYVVFPGNVGQVETLADIVSALR